MAQAWSGVSEWKATVTARVERVSSLMVRSMSGEDLVMAAATSCKGALWKVRLPVVQPKSAAGSAGLAIKVLLMADGSDGATAAIPAVRTRRVELRATATEPSATATRVGASG